MMPSRKLGQESVPWSSLSSLKRTMRPLYTCKQTLHAGPAEDIKTIRKLVKIPMVKEVIFTENFQTMWTVNENVVKFLVLNSLQE